MDPIITIPTDLTPYKSSEVIPVSIQTQVSNVSKTSIAQIKAKLQNLADQTTYYSGLLDQVAASVPVISIQADPVQALDSQI